MRSLYADVPIVEIPINAEYESKKEMHVPSLGDMQICSIKHKAKILVILGLRYNDEQMRQSKEHKKARNKEGEKPANQTKSITNKNEKPILIFFPAIFFDAEALKPAKKDKCIPESAKTWDKPAFLNPVLMLFSRYSLDPQRSARSNAPAASHAYIRRLN